MNKQELVLKVAEKASLSKKEAEKFVEAFMDTVADALVEGDKVALLGFGMFETRERSAREARNPATGETLKLAAKTVPAFKPGKALKEAVNK